MRCLRSTARPAKKSGTAANRSPAQFVTAQSGSATAKCTFRQRTGLFMLSAFRWSTKFVRAVSLAIFALVLCAQPAEIRGREETARLCGSCHELEKSFSLRQDRDGW